MSEKKPVEKENVIFGSIKSTKIIYQDDSQKANNFNDDENYLIKIFLEANTDKISKPLFINKLHLKIRRKRKKLEKEKERRTNDLIDFLRSSNILYKKNINELLAKLGIDKYIKDYLLKVFSNSEYPLLDGYETNIINNFNNNSANVANNFIPSDEQNSQNNNNISNIDNNALIIHLKEMHEFSDLYKNLLELWNIYGKPYTNSLINNGLEFSDPYENLLDLWNIHGQPNINSIINYKFEFSDPYENLIDVGNLYKDKSENQFRKNIDEFSNTRINSINEDEFEIAEQNKSLFGEDKNIFESEEQYLNSFAKEMNEFADNNMEINRDYYDI